MIEPEDEVYGVYDGPAILRTIDTEHAVRLRVSGRLDPIDGRFHWQGTVYGTTGNLSAQRLPLPVTVTVGEHSAPAKITELTSQNRLSVVGKGAPPFGLDRPPIAPAQQPRTPRR